MAVAQYGLIGLIVYLALVGLTSFGVALDARILGAVAIITAVLIVVGR